MLQGCSGVVALSSAKIILIHVIYHGKYMYQRYICSTCLVKMNYK